MKKLLVSVLYILFFSLTMTAQVGIGTVAPEAELDISGRPNGGGILLPRYALLGDDDNTTVQNPQGGALVEGTLIYNTATVTGGNALDPGFLHWDGAQWKEIGSATKVMMRRLPPSINGTFFNFPIESFSNIDGTSYNIVTSELTLPRGIYEVESNLRLNSNTSIEWATVVDGAEVSGSVRGTANPPNFNSNASASPAVAVFEITANTGELQFRLTNASGTLPPAIFQGQCFVIIKKIN